jgi:hypothetical protein
MKRLTGLALLGLTLLTPGAARAQASYKIQPIVKFGDKLGDVVIKTAGGDFEIGTLNDAGQLVFVTENDAGGETLIQFADGKFTPIVVSGKDAPGGKWPQGVGLASPVSMNQRGNIVFAAGGFENDNLLADTFLWDFTAQKVTPVARKGMPAVNNLTFETGGDFFPVINNFGEIAFPAAVKNAAGQAKNGLFFLGRDGKLLPVALPDQALPGGGKVSEAVKPSLNDAGVVAFLTQIPDDLLNGAYVWEQGTITPLAVIDTDAPGGGKFALILSARVNNKNRTVLVLARLNTRKTGPIAFYRFAEGKLTLLLAPGQEMPGGGKLKGVPHGFSDVSVANEAGQHAFVARLEDDSTAAYLLEADGTLRLILKSGTMTDLGKITNVGVGAGDSFGVGLNAKGQVALTVQIDGGADTIVLLTPAAP